MEEEFDSLNSLTEKQSYRISKKLGEAYRELKAGLTPKQQKLLYKILEYYSKLNKNI